MQLTVLDRLPETDVEDLGPVSAVAVEGLGFLRDIATNWRDLFGGRGRSYEKGIEKALVRATRQLEESARERGATAVVGLRFDVETVHTKGGGYMVLVIATGQAIRSRPAAI